MSIDGIGRGGGPPKIGGKSPAVGAGSGEKFEVPAARAGGSVEEAKGAELLSQVQSGEVSLDAYLDIRVGQAVHHLEGSLTAEQLQFIKGELRQQLQEDPVLADLVRRATGKAVSGSEG